jgi:phosphohistidine phosphatase
MSRLLLLRHAKAVWAKPGMKDFERPLDPEGHASLDRLAEAMKSVGLFPRRVVLSGAQRTRETAFGLIERLGVAVETVIDDGIYSGGAGEYMRAIRAQADAGPGDAEPLMLVGHNPSMEDLALALCGDGERNAMTRLQAGFPTAALAAISFKSPLADIGPESGYLESFPLPARRE